MSEDEWQFLQGYAKGEGVPVQREEATMRVKLILTLTPHWRVATDYDLQWILQRRTGKKQAAWRSIHYCTQRDSLLRVIREEIGTLGYL